MYFRLFLSVSLSSFSLEKCPHRFIYLTGFFVCLLCTGVEVQHLLNPLLRAHLGMTTDQSGVLVTDVVWVRTFTNARTRVRARAHTHAHYEHVRTSTTHA